MFSGRSLNSVAGWLFYQLKDFLISSPGSDTRLGVTYIQDHLQMVVVQAVVPRFHNHLVAVRGAILVEPGGVIKVVRVDDKRIALPMANAYPYQREFDTFCAGPSICVERSASASA